ncbi:MAG: hypothetical protein JXB32_04760 [Deltaproteobacteria bacterium]|nr:hypothetical protein [Deltaproteobacteria bacterium]
MRRVDLHPEELMRGAREDRVPADGDPERLAEHLAGCDACAFERAVVQDFAEELHREEDGERRVMAQEIAGALADPRVQASLSWQAHGRPLAVRMPRGLLVAAIILGSSLAAAAGAWFAVKVILVAGSEERPPAVDASAGVKAADVPACEPQEPAPPEARPAGRRGRGRRPAEVPETPPEVPEAPAEVPETPPEAAPVGPTVPSGHHAARSPPPSAPAPGETAQTLLVRANAARRVGDIEAATRAYDELARRFPGSREEVLSRATYGKLLLEVLGQPQRALGLFEAYLAAAPDGTLAEEALVGRAVALGRLGRAARERAAWEELLVCFPESAHAERARARLEELR